MADHMITTYREKAEKWVQQAEKAQRRVYMGPMARFKFQDASNYLELAGQCFRVAKRFQDAGVAYKQCGRLEEKLNNPEVAASFYHEAALCFQKDDPQEAAACYLTAINLFCQRQLFSTAARLECEVAELMQNDRNRRLAIVHHIKAADFYRANTCFEEATDRCLLKAAHALALSESYVEAASLFQEVGRRMLVDDLLGFNTPDAFLKAVLCLQCASGMPEPVPEVHQGHGAEAPSPRPTLNAVKATIVALGKASSVFRGSMAYIFATDVALAEKEGDVDFFAARLYAYNNVCCLSAWYLRMLKTIGDHIQVKAAQLRKMRALQEKLRRRQRAEERAKDRIKRRQQDLSIKDDSSEGTTSQANDFASSSEDTLPTNTDTKPTQSSSHSSSESGGSDSNDDDGGGSRGTDSSSGDSGSDDSEASSGTSDSSPSSSSSSLESGSSGSSESSKENPTDEDPSKKSSAKTKAVGGAGGASATVSDSDSSATRSETFSENSNSTIVNAPNTKKNKNKGSVRFAKNNPSASDSDASNAASGSAESSGDSEGGSSSGSSEDSKGADNKAGKGKSGKNTPGKQTKSEGGKKTKSSFWKRR